MRFLGAILSLIEFVSVFASSLNLSLGRSPITFLSPFILNILLLEAIEAFVTLYAAHESLTLTQTVDAAELILPIGSKAGTVASDLAVTLR